MSTTGTGASGEMRVTSPHTNSSSITSPSTTTLFALKPPTKSFALDPEMFVNLYLSNDSASTRSTATFTSLVVTSRMQTGSSNSPQVYPGHGAQGMSCLTTAFGTRVQ